MKISIFLLFGISFHMQAQLILMGEFAFSMGRTIPRYEKEFNNSLDLDFSTLGELALGIEISDSSAYWPDFGVGYVNWVSNFIEINNNVRINNISYKVETPVNLNKQGVYISTHFRDVFTEDLRFSLIAYIPIESQLSYRNIFYYQNSDYANLSFNPQIEENFSNGIDYLMKFEYGSHDFSLHFEFLFPAALNSDKFHSIYISSVAIGFTFRNDFSNF